MAESEFRIYDYIKDVLKELGWDTKNPSRGGNVYVQGEFYDHSNELTEALELAKPENIVCIPWDGGFCYWVIEAKRNHKDISIATSEAKNYADRINSHPNSAKAFFATGIAGSPEQTYYVETSYWNGNCWKAVSINNYEATGFLTFQQCIDILEKNTSNIEQFDADPDRFFKRASKINQTLHDNSIAVSDRAKVLGALLLSLAAEGRMRIHRDPTWMLQEVNGNIEQILREHGKEAFADNIKLKMPATRKNHFLFRKAVVETLQLLREMNVRSAINSGDDALGKFYEIFLKYANGAKEMGIVLTPRHITKFAIETLGVTSVDRVYDPTCGTGGFLVAAMDQVRNTAKSASLFNEFKKTGIWGVEREDDVYCLALVNMIFRGDGKSGLEDGDCFDHQFWMRDDKIFFLPKGEKAPDGSQRPFTRVFMNPPFKRKSHPETDFIDHALEQCKSKALLFAVLPAVSISGKRFANWRGKVLERHSLKAVIKFDKNLFYPVQEGTYALVFEVNKPHDFDVNVLMAILADDNSRPRLSKMLSKHDAVDNMSENTERLKRFLLEKPLDSEDIPQQMIVTKLKNDEEQMFAPEMFIKSISPTDDPDLETRALDYLKAIIKNNRQKPIIEPRQSNTKRFKLLELVDEEISPPLQSIKEYAEGNVPLVSATASNNGISEWKDIPSDKIYSHLISISKTHNTMPCQAFWHPYSFSAIGTVYLLKLLPKFTASEAVMLYICQEITERNAWRYDYARPVKLDEIELFLPADNFGHISVEAIEERATRQLKGIIPPP